MAAAIIKCKSVKPNTLAILETNYSMADSPVKSEEVYVEKRDKTQIELDTNSGRMALKTHSVEATIFTDPTRPNVTFRLRTVEENLA